MLALVPEFPPPPAGPVVSGPTKINSIPVVGGLHHGYERVAD